jgi:hypothetical protein
MKIRLFVSIAAAAFLAPAVCFAQASTASGAVGGAVAGAVVGGPVGAVVGGVIGGSIGAAAEPPREVQTYVMQERIPSVAVQEEVVVGRPLPATVELRAVPQHNEYAYAVVNNRRVIVEPSTRKIIKVIE